MKTNLRSSFATIQAAINASSPGDQINVRPGTYDEDVNVNKDDLRLVGAGAESTNIRGPVGGPGTTVQISADNVTVAGFTVTRLDNNTTDWNNPGLNSAGFAIQGLSATGATIRDNVITASATIRRARARAPAASRPARRRPRSARGAPSSS